MSLKRTIRTGRIVTVALITFSVLLTSCGGSSGGAVPIAGEPEDNTGMHGAPDELLPDFTVLSISSSADTTAVFNVQATIMNVGDKAAAVPAGWFMVSTDPDFIDNYLYKSVRLQPQSPDQNSVLQPGETGTYTASTSRFFTEVNIAQSRSGTHYGKLWLNPDLSKRFINPEDSVIESHDIQERDYENNLSDIVAYESVRTVNQGPDCNVDVYEENDSLALATPIMVGQSYDFNGCDELFEVMIVELETSTSYVLQQNDTRVNSYWDLTVISPDGRYLARGLRENNLITTRQVGLHHIVASFRSVSGSIQNLSIEIIKR